MGYRIHTEVTLKLGKMPEYARMMARLVPYLAEYGWTLEQALQPVTGDFRKLVHVWKLDSFAAVEAGLGACGAPAGQAILAPIAELVEAETIQIMTPTAYV